ncbi:MAG: hypothetical protein E7515_05140 [Ruminococcaceae bacterium]|nr:hypothetical protein [Oscillospiraceae bacterium]
MKKILLIILSITVILSLCSCKKAEPASPPSTEGTSTTQTAEKAEEKAMYILKINEKEFQFTPEENETANEFLKRLPLSLSMSELNGNEKYFYLENSLPSDEKSVALIQKGDIMLYGDNCIVVFYKTFPTTYKYTKIGHIDDPDELDEALGDGSVTVEFSAVN